MADMGGFLDILRRGDWLTLSRMRLWALAVLAASAGGLFFLAATSDGLSFCPLPTAVARASSTPVISATARGVACCVIVF